MINQKIARCWYQLVGRTENEQDTNGESESEDVIMMDQLVQDLPSDEPRGNLSETLLVPSRTSAALASSSPRRVRRIQFHTSAMIASVEPHVVPLIAFNLPAARIVCLSVVAISIKSPDVSVQHRSTFLDDLLPFLAYGESTAPPQTLTLLSILSCIA